MHCLLLNICMSGQLHTPAAFTMVKEPRNVWMGGWMDCRVGTGAENKREMFSAGGRAGDYPVV
jgi:hypothetical protein